MPPILSIVIKHICVYTHISKYKLLGLYNVAHTCVSGRTICYWTASWCDRPRERPSLPLSPFFSCCSSLWRVEASWAFPHSRLLLFLFISCLCIYVGETFSIRTTTTTSMADNHQGTIMVHVPLWQTSALQLDLRST